MERSSSQLYVGMDGWDGIGWDGYQLSQSTFGANKCDIFFWIVTVLHNKQDVNVMVSF